MGLLTAFIGGAGEGLAAVGKQAADYLARSALQNELAEIQKERDLRLAEIQKERDLRLAELERGTLTEVLFPFRREERREHEQFQRGIKELELSTQERIQNSINERMTEIARLDRESREKIAAMTLRGALAEVASRNLVIQPTDNGIVLIDKASNKVTPLTVDGQPLRAPKDTFQGLRLLVDAAKELALNPDPNVQKLAVPLYQSLMKSMGIVPSINDPFSGRDAGGARPTGLLGSSVPSFTPEDEEFINQGSTPYDVVARRKEVRSGQSTLRRMLEEEERRRREEAFLNSPNPTPDTGEPALFGSLRRRPY